MPTVRAESLKGLIARVLAAAGAPRPAAQLVADSLVLSNLKGVDSHGLVRVAQYVADIEAGLVDACAEPHVDRQDALAVVDGRRGFGQIAAQEATRAALELAPGGISCATVANVHHVGRLGEYVELAAAGGFIALAFCNTGPAHGRVVPFGGSRPALGTNPIAYAIPAGTHAPIVSDFSTAAAAEGRVRLARHSGASVPAGWIIDANGRPSRNPYDLYAGGALLPAAGHKGYALALLAEILGGAFAGAGCASTGSLPGNGVVLFVLDPGTVRPLDTFLAEVDRVIESIRDVPPAQSVERVLLPGEPEARVEARRRAEGIPIPESIWNEFTEVAGRYGINVAASPT